jgi:hypothetical protein
VICHPSYVPPDRPASWTGGGNNFKIMNGNIIQAASSTKIADYEFGTMSHTIYSRSCHNIEISNLTLTANSNNDATILRLRSIQNAIVKDVIINNNVKTILNRHYPGQNSVLIEGGSGEYDIHDIKIYGGPHHGMAIGGDFDSCEVYDNEIRHDQAYVNGYALSISGDNIDVHNNNIIPISGRGAHITGTNIKFHHNFLDLKLGQVIDHTEGQTDYHSIFTNVHGIKLENSGSMNNRIYSNVVVATQPDENHAPPTPLNIDAEGSNANNLIYDNEFTAITYSATSGGTSGYGVFDTYAPGIYVMQCSSSNPASIYNNHFKSNDWAIHIDGYSCSSLKIFNNTFELIDDATTNSHTITYNNYNSPSHGFNLSGNKFIGYEPDDIWFRSDTYTQLSNFMEFNLKINVVDENDNSVAYPEIIINNNDGDTVFDGIGDGNGQLEKSLLMYEMNRANNPEIYYHYPYTIIVGDNQEIVELNENKEITISTEYVSECEDYETNHPEWIWCDDFDDGISMDDKYFEYDDDDGDHIPTSNEALSLPNSMQVIYQQGEVEAGGFKKSFGRTPIAYIGGNSERTNEDFDEIYWRIYLKNELGWEGSPAKLNRATIMASEDNWAQAMIGHLWSSGDYLLMDPASGINSNSQLITTRYNDFENLIWLGNKPGTTPIFSTAESGKWFCIEGHVKLNTPGNSNGIQEFWINDNLEAGTYNLNWIKSWSGYGINSVFHANYWNDGAIKEQTRYFDNFVISTERIGCIGTISPNPNPNPDPEQCTPADSNSNGDISNLEMDEYIASWLDGNVILTDLFDAIDKWKNDCN